MCPVIVQQTEAKEIALAKLKVLEGILSQMGSVMIAFSGGVDSVFLTKVASDVLNDKAIAVTANSSTYTSREFKESKEIACLLGVEHIIIYTKELEDNNFSSNPPDRCYFCKRELFSRLKELAKNKSINFIADGSNYDDLQDYRPGMKAVSEFGARSPLIEAKLTKEEIRSLSKDKSLPTWDKPATPCLSSRFPYGTKITKEKLGCVEKAEEKLRKFGLKECRVRVHGDLARIEVLKQDIPKLFENNISEKIVSDLKALGFLYVTLDLEGYRMGSMNDAIKKGVEVG